MSTTGNSRRLRWPAVALLCVLSLPAALVQAAWAPKRPARIDLGAIDTAKQFDRFIVKYRGGTPEAGSESALVRALDVAAVRTKSQIQRVITQRGGKTIAQPWVLNHVRRMSVGADVVRSTRKLGRAQVRLLMQQIADNPNVEYVEIDQVLHAVATANDPQFVNQWALTDADAGIRADKAWDLATGSGVVVAVIDTGITVHSDLSANVLPGYDFITDLTSANDGNGRDSDASDPGDSDGTKNSSWHGTHVAGTIAAITNNSIGVAGVAYTAKIVPVRVLGIGGGAGSDIADGITWASGGSVPGAPANTNPAEVINMSLGGGGNCSATYQAVINAAVARGTTVVVAAGNDSVDVVGSSLASCDNVVVVGAVTSNSSRSSFSNYGARVDVSAPGSSIISTINTGASAPVGEGYAYYSGTSMATPHVAAAAALVQSHRVAHGQTPYTPAEVEAQLKATAYPMTLGCVGVSGTGIIDSRTLLDVDSSSTRLLANGVAANNLSAGAGGALNFAFVAPSTSTGLTLASTGGSGNADLYLKFGSAPTTASYDCRSNAAGNGESCSIPTTQPGTYYVMLQGATAFSSVSLTGSASGNLKPVPAFSVSATGLTANFTDTSTDVDSGIASRNWNFGDGSSSTIATPSRTYALAGGYMVNLKSTDAAGATSCTLREVAVNPPTMPLSNGVAVTGLAGKTNAELRYTLAVPAGATALNFSTVNGTGDADLYVKFGSAPTTSSYDCASTSPTTTESCPIVSAQAGAYYVLVQAFVDIAGVSLTGSFNGASSNVAPTANFTSTTSGLTANFTDASSDSDGSIASRSWNFGDGSTSTATSPSRTYASAGTYNVSLTVTDNGGLTNTVTKPVTVASAGGPAISIDNVTITEGNSGTRLATFHVTLSAPAATTVTYSIATADGSATAGSDYVAKSMSAQKILAGATSKNFTVSIKGDTTAESTETFTVNLTAVTGASVADAQGIATISDDDSVSTGGNLSIGDVTVTEGNSGTTQAVFTVQLSQPAAGPVTFSIATADGTARSTAGDFVAKNLVGQTIPTGSSSAMFSVTVNGDTVLETNERFRVNVSGVTGATVTDAQAFGTIANDD